MSDSVIRIEGLGKRYRIGAARERYTALRDVVAGGAKSLGRRLLGRKVSQPAYEDFWALQDVSFEVRRGDCIGVIGRNGAGKSTLLKLLSRITEPTTGGFRIKGRLASLLEVGTGFHPELTGRENVFLNGAILGMTRAEIRRKFDEIVAFAEVEKFLDTPVKHYSSGMYMRLAFAVAAHLEPEILVVDEVLAVGDAEFQRKCLGKMGDVSREGRTVLFVSHNMHAVKSLCGRTVVMARGRVEFDGSASDGVARYLERSRATNESAGTAAGLRPGTGDWRFTEAVATKPVFDPSEPLEFEFEVSPRRPDAGNVYLSGVLVNEQGIVLCQFDSRLIAFSVRGSNSLKGRLRLAAIWLKPGRYSLDLHICSPGVILDLFERAVEFDVSPVLPYPHSSSPDATVNGVVLTDFAWSISS